MILKVALLLVGLVALGAVYHFSGDPFYVSGGSDSAETIVDLPQEIRLLCTVIAGIALIMWTLRPSLMTTIIALIAISSFVLAHNTVRISGKSFEVIQKLALVPVNRFPFEEGSDGDLTGAVFRGIGPLSLDDAELSEAMSGLKFVR